MENLISLVNTISRNKVKQIEIINDTKKSSSKLVRLYLGISEKKFQHDDEAADHFYGTHPHKKIYYNRLKRKLNERLLNTLFFIDINRPDFTEIQKAYYTCYKNLSLVKILIGRSNRKNAIILAEKTLKKARKFEFSDVILGLTTELRLHYGTIVGNPKKFNFYNKLVRTTYETYLGELKAEEYYSEIIIHFVNSRANNNEIIKIADRFLANLDKIKKHNSYRLNFLTYLTMALRYEIANDYENTLKICLQAVKYFKSKKHLSPPTVIYNFKSKILACYIKLGEYNDAELISKKCLDLVQEGSVNWYITLHYRMIVTYYTKQFQHSFHIFQKAISHPNLKDQYQNISEYWRIHEAFIYYFVYTKKISSDRENLLKKFRVSKFLNEVPFYSKDKRGTNIIILILQILLLLQQGKYGEIIDRMESLKTYTHRYLRKDDTFRSNCFIKMLLCLPAESFHKKAVIRKAKKYKDKLESVPLEIANQSAEIEIVPYEMLWEFVLESLDEKWH